MSEGAVGLLAGAELRRLRAEVERLRGENETLDAALAAAVEEVGPLESERDRLRAVLAETPENVAAIHAKLGRSLNWNEVIATVLADQRARAGVP